MCFGGFNNARAVLKNSPLVFNDGLVVLKNDLVVFNNVLVVLKNVPVVSTIGRFWKMIRWFSMVWWF